MIKKLFVILFLIFNTGLVAAQERMAGDSAEITSYSRGIRYNKVSYKQESKAFMAKKRAIISMLAKRNSPLLTSTDTFIQMCTDNKLDCYLLPSIAGLESSFGQFIAPSTYNPFGWGGGYIEFSDWDEAIRTVGQGLKDNYIGEKGASIEQIGSKYAESKTWAVRVRSFMAQFRDEEEKQLNSSNFAIEL